MEILKMRFFKMTSENPVPLPSAPRGAVHQCSWIPDGFRVDSGWIPDKFVGKTWIPWIPDILLKEKSTTNIPFLLI